MPLLPGLFPAAHQHGLRIIYELCAKHFPGKVDPVCRGKCSPLIICAYSDRKTGTHFLRNTRRSVPKQAVSWTGNHPTVSRNEAILASTPPQVSTILASLGQAAFVWDVATDAIAWSDHASSVFPDIPAAALASGVEFSKLIEPERSIRIDALGHAAPAHGADGTPYRIEYGVRTTTSAPVLWIEETGCWFAR